MAKATARSVADKLLSGASKQPMQLAGKRNKKGGVTDAEINDNAPAKGKSKSAPTKKFAKPKGKSQTRPADIAPSSPHRQRPALRSAGRFRRVQ